MIQLSGKIKAISEDLSLGFLNLANTSLYRDFFHTAIDLIKKVVFMGGPLKEKIETSNKISSTLGTRGFLSRAAGTLFRPKTEAARKPFGPKRYGLPFPLNFDHFRRINFLHGRTNKMPPVII